MPNSVEPPLQITQADSMQAVAIIGHMRQILRTVSANGRVRRPVYADHSEVLLASAAMRALFFDDSPAPMLISFLDLHGKSLAVEALETDSSMLLLSVIEHGHARHISDFFTDIMLNPSTREQFQIDEPHPFVCVLQEGDPRIKEIASHEHIWAPGPGIEALENNSLGYQPDTGICQFSRVTRRLVELKDWGSVRIGFLREKSITRRNVACYVANKLGGVHYDSTRLPTAQSDADEFRKLAIAYDWDQQAVMHAGMIAITLMCIELVHMPWYAELLSSLELFHQRRQERLINGLPVGKSGSDLQG